MAPLQQKTEMAEIGHLIRNYLGLTETFIYAYLAHAIKTQPFVLTDTTRNQVSFPMTGTYLLSENEAADLEGEGFEQHLEYPACFERLIRERQIGLLHAHFGPMGWKGLALKRKLGIPLVTTFYGYDASGLLREGFWPQAYSQLFRDGDMFLALGSDMAKRLHKAGCPANKLQIVHLGVDVASIPFRKRTWSTGKVVLLYCGRLVEKKGVLDAIEAFAPLASKWDNLTFRIVGEGPLRSKVKQAIQKHNLQRRVVLLGALPHAKVFQEMRRAHVFVLPSKTARNGDMEGTPTVLIEAQASGLPVVSTYHADIPEVAIDGETGFLVPEGNHRVLADCLDSLLTRPELWAQMGLRGRQHVECHYNIHTEVALLESIYTGLMA